MKFAVAILLGLTTAIRVNQKTSSQVTTTDEQPSFFDGVDTNLNGAVSPSEMKNLVDTAFVK